MKRALSIFLTVVAGWFVGGLIGGLLGAGAYILGAPEGVETALGVIGAVLGIAWGARAGWRWGRQQEVTR